MRIPGGASLISFVAVVVLQIGCAGAVAQQPPNTSSSTAADPPKITTTSLPTAQAGVSYSAPIAVSGGLAPFHWSTASGNLPLGLAMDSRTGLISGKAAAAGDSDVDVLVTDSVN